MKATTKAKAMMTAAKQTKAGRIACKVVDGNGLLISLVIAMAFAIILGVGLKGAGTELPNLKYWGFPGEMLMRMLKMLILPLIISSLICGLADLDTNSCGKIGARAVIYYMTTTFIAITIGIILVVSIQPGSLVRTRGAVGSGTSYDVSIADSMLDLVRNFVPDNVVEACFRSVQTYARPLPVKAKELPPANVTMNATAILNATMATKDDAKCTCEAEDTGPKQGQLVKKESMNILGIVVFSIAMGIIISAKKEKCRPLREVFYALNEAVMSLVQVIMLFSPIGVFFLIFHKIMSMGDPLEIFSLLGYYSLTVVIGLALHGWIILPLSYFLIVRKNPLSYIKNLAPALLTALGTSSSSATLPVTFNCLEEANKVDKRITRFVLPIGATINMDGTALYEAVAPIFIMQYKYPERSMDIVTIITIALTATFASVGAAGIPQAGLVTMVMVLTAVNMDPEDVGLILAIDWLLDRLRTMTNVLGDAIGAGIVEHLSRNDPIMQQPLEEDMISIKESCSDEGSHHGSQHGHDNKAATIEIADKKDAKHQGNK